ncbi:MAG: FHA domain-containing protein [Myxococcaceae bacterium]|nr:FHA domain-containing protein [Myxococcaceae bacterium]
MTAGAGAGGSFAFDAEARLGRTADNDVVVKDQAASRSHARVFSRGGAYYVEDLGSANGTKLNSSRVKQARALKPGDAIVIGDTVLEFSVEDAGAAEAAEAPSSTLDEDRDDAAAVPADEDGAGEEEAQEAAPEPPRASSRRPPPRRSRPPARTSSSDDEPQDDEGPDGSADDAAPEGDPPPERSRSGAAGRGNALARRGPATSAAPPRSSRARAALAVRDEAESPELSVADRARERRQLNQSATGRVQLMWSDLPRPARLLLGGFGALFALATFGFAAWVAWPRNVVNKPEPRALRADGLPLEDSFGLGAVTFQTPDQKALAFTATAPTRVVGVLHYQAAQVSADEVSINLNGNDLGSVPADDLDPDSRELEVVLPAAQMKTQEENLLVFDNTKNPPGEDPWKIWNLWVEVIPVPDMSADEARRRAQLELDKAAKDYELREVGAANLFRSWKTYREAWLLLEATPDAPPELLSIARTRMKEIRPELDRKCNAMLVKFKTIVNTRQNSYEDARQVLEHIPEYFPTREHPCHNFSKAMLRSVDGLDFAAEGDEG